MSRFALDEPDPEPYGYDGIERSCTGCGEPVMVSRSEAYTVQVWCVACGSAYTEPDQRERNEEIVIRAARQRLQEM